MTSTLKKILKYVLLGMLALTAVFIFLAYLPLRYIPLDAQRYETIIINNVSVVDVVNDTIYSARNILIKDNQIQEIATAPLAGTSAKSQNMKVIDGGGKFVIPALWDMHAHLIRLSPYVTYPSFLTHGVTHVRDMRGAYNERDPFAGVQRRLQKWDEAVASYELAGPRIHGFTSFAIEGPNPMFNKSPDFFNCATPEDTKKLISYFVENKISLIKIYNNIPRESFFTLMQEARSAGIAVAGHKPVRVSAIEASNAGMKSLEHAKFLFWDSFSGSEALQNHPDPLSTYNTALRRKMLDEHDTVKLFKIFAAFKENGTWYCPTHLTRKADAFADDPKFRKRYSHVNPILRMLSFEDLDATIHEDTTAAGRKTYRDFYFKSLEITKQAYEHGVKILAGSDVPELPGRSLHDELQELAKAGIPSNEILRTATLYPAQYYNLQEKYGTVEEGKQADLLLLTANPIENIENTRSIEAVIFEGIYIDRKKLQEINQSTVKTSNSLLISIKLIRDILISMTI